MRWLSLALVLAACSPAPCTMPHQAEATALVWNQQLGMTGPAPSIGWVMGSDLDCGEGHAWTSYSFSPPLCVSGLSFWDTFDSEVAWPANATFSTTAFAHELCHQRNGVVSGGSDLDPNHLGECFVQGGLVDQANAALAAMGL